MNSDIWAVWGDINFLAPTLGFVISIIIAIFFECKYLDERKKNAVYRKSNQCLMKYAAKPTIAPLKPMSVIQNAADGRCQLGSTPIGIITNPSATTPPIKIKATLTTLSEFIIGIIRRLQRRVNHKQTEPRYSV